MQSSYLPFTLKDTHKDWEREWFFVEDPEPSLPPRKPEMPTARDCWIHGKAGMGGDDVETLQTMIKSMREAGLTGAHVFADFLKRRVQPLQLRKNPAYAFAGKEDPSRLLEEDISDKEVETIVARYVRGGLPDPVEIQTYDATKPPTQVSIDDWSCFVKAVFFFVL